ncbi:MAG: SDR family NAD(P)-dependent oxidoreductase, partial [Moorea sp. SIO3C2]|nr:SDR family NAD(P)-dependent oxidoreductase [Moorena sp. SIO3C2]
VELGDICYTARVGRAHFEHRLAIVSESLPDLRRKLINVLDDDSEFSLEQVPEFAQGQTSASARPQIAFLFTGQGSQYLNMGRQLYQTRSVFRDAIDQCDQILQSELDVALIDLLYPQTADEQNAARLNDTAYTQPALFAIEYALAQLWQSWGIQPAVVMGHSVGEYVAATIAGVFDLETGLKLIAARGRLMQQLPAGGAMVSVMASEERVRSLISPHTEKISIAAINGPESVVISGEAEVLGAIASQLESAGVKTKSLQVSHAFHSPLMEPILAEFATVAEQRTYHPPRIPLISNVTGVKADEQIATAQYWVNHIRQPVRFAHSMEALSELGYDCFLEIGPKPILLGMGRQCLPEGTGVWLPSLRPTVDDEQQMLSSLGQLYVCGSKVDWFGFDQHDRQKVALPTYPFQRQRYWIEANGHPKTQKRLLLPEKMLHPLLGQRLHFAGQQHLFEALLGEDEPFYLQHHRVFNHALFPTTAYLEMALVAGQQYLKTPYPVVEDIVIGRGMVLSAEELKTVQTILTPSDQQSCQFQIFSQQQQDDKNDPEWVLHASGLIRTGHEESSQPHIDLEQYWDKCHQSIEVEQHYQRYRTLGIDYGSTFQGIQQVWRGENQAIAKLELPQALLSQIPDYQIHPALLDAALQVIIHALPEISDQQTYLPVGVDQFKVNERPGSSLWACASVMKTQGDDNNGLATQVMLVGNEGNIIATIEGLRVKSASPQVLLGNVPDAITKWLYEVEWRPKARFGQLLPPDLLSPQAIERHVNPDLDTLFSQVDLENIQTFQVHLEQLSVNYVVRALQAMGWSYQPETSFVLDDVAADLSIIASQKRLFHRLLQMLADVGIVQEKNQQWQVRQNLPTVNPDRQKQVLLEQFPHEQATLTLLHQCASELSEVLQGTQDPVQLVFPEGDLTTATQVYQESPMARVMNTLVQKSITKGIETLPPNRGLRVLEIGAGTGGTTSYILPHLDPTQTEYVFTDIGVLFTTKAQERFKDYSFLSYQVLDIETDPVSQGFKAHQYDVVIAANVLHATTNLHQTLSQVRMLLAPGGLLVLLEVTSRNRWPDLVFGLLEGWWKFNDHELRPDYPLLSRAQWQQLLRETGFSETIALPDIDGMSEVLGQQAVIVAQGDRTPLEQTTTSKNWFLLADQQGIAEQVATQLHAIGERCTLVFAGDQYQQVSQQEFIINPHNPAEFEQLITQMIADAPDLYGVVNFWTTNVGAERAIDGQELERLSQLGCGSTLFLVQALVKGHFSSPPRLWLVTQGAQPVPDQNPVIPGVAQSSVWGLGKVIDLEHPELHCVRVDVDPQKTVEDRAGKLLAEIWSQDPEDQVALRGNTRYVARLVGSRHPRSDIPLNFRAEGTYMITGGVSGLGLLVAQWMIEKGAKSLVLVTRRSPDDETLNKLNKLEQMGAQVMVEKADVSEFSAMAKVIERINQSSHPLAGIIHSAGMLSDGILQNQSWSSFEQVMAPKVQGAWHLHQLTKEQPLDFFVLFSSAASLLGSPGQGNHSAANAFLDGLAHYRRAMGLTGLSIHWGAVSQVGEAAERGADVRAFQRGMGAISPSQVLESLELLMSGSGVEVGVVPIEWSAWQERVEKWPFLADWEQAATSIEPTPTMQGGQLLAEIKAASGSEREKLLMAYLQDATARVLGMKISQVDVQQPLNQMGLDSLMAVELRNRVKTKLAVDIPITKFMEELTVTDISTEINQQLTLLEQKNSTPSDKHQQLRLGNVNNNDWIEVDL